MCVSIYETLTTEDLGEEAKMEAAAGESQRLIDGGHSTAGNADGEEEWPAALPRNAVVFMSVISVLFAVAAAWVVGRMDVAGGGDDDVVPRYLSAAMWRLSPLLCGYLFAWTVVVFPDTPSTVLTLAVRVSFLVMLADAGAALVKPAAIGKAFMYAATLYSAGGLGSAVADRRQRAGTERSAAAAADTAPAYQSKADKGHDGTLDNLAVFVLTVIAIFLAAITLVPDPSPDGSSSGAGLFNMMVFSCPALFAWSFLVTERLPGGALVANDTFCVGIAVMVLWMLFVVPIGGYLVAGRDHMIVVVVGCYWLTAMGIAGFIGYARAVSARYKELLRIKRSKPIKAADASGLPVGREVQDSCSAHIEASDTVCLPGRCPSCSTPCFHANMT